MKRKRLGIVDLGTNSVRFAVHEIGPKSNVEKLHRHKVMVRLGRGVFTEKKLNKRAVAQTVAAFTRFKEKAAKLQTEKIIAVATSALREANDAQRLLQNVKRKTGIRIRVISGKEEARLIAQGILSNETTLYQKFALVDIGGGSTEISICKRKTLLSTSSLPLGSARLHQVFLRSHNHACRNPKRMEPLKRHAKRILETRIANFEALPTRRIIGSGGTIKTLCRITKKLWNEEELTSERLAQLIRKMLKLELQQLRKLPGMDQKRADMILSGAILLQQCMHTLGARSVVATAFSLRHGILAEELRKLAA